MRLFAPNRVVAKSRFWYFLMKLKKVKKSTGEIISLNEVRYNPSSGAIQAFDILTSRHRSMRSDP